MSRLGSIVLTSPGLSISLPVLDAKPSDPFQLIGADGLGPPETDVIMGQSVYRGGVFQGSFPKDREIVLLVTLNRDYKSTALMSIAQMRSMFYRLLTGPDPITITVNISPGIADDHVPGIIKTQGYVRRIETVPFSKDPQLQLTIACPLPYLNAMDLTNVPFTPNIFVSTPFTFYCDGTAIVGFEWDFEINSAPTKITVKAVANNGVAETIGIPGPRISGERFSINTNPGARQIFWTDPTPPAESGDITGMCTVTSDRWPSVHPDNNVLQVLDGSNNPLAVMTTRLRYTAKYWGI